MQLHYCKGNDDDNKKSRTDVASVGSAVKNGDVSSEDLSSGTVVVNLARTTNFPTKDLGSNSVL